MQLNRTPGSVFVSVEAPAQKNAQAAISADWKSIAHGMIAEATPPAGYAGLADRSGIHTRTRQHTGTPTCKRQPSRREHESPYR